MSAIEALRQSVIGQEMVGRFVSSAYENRLSARKDAPREKTGAEAGRADVVQLSDQAPKPLEASLFRKAMDAAKRHGQGNPALLEEGAVREDHVFSALAAIRLFGDRSLAGGIHWPAGLPGPNEAEMAEAYRRLSQRLVGLEERPDARELSEMRQSLLDKLRDADFSAWNASREKR